MLSVFGCGCVSSLLGSKYLLLNPVHVLRAPLHPWGPHLLHERDSPFYQLYITPWTLYTLHTEEMEWCHPVQVFCHRDRILKIGSYGREKLVWSKVLAHRVKDFGPWLAGSITLDLR